MAISEKDFERMQQRLLKGTVAKPVAPVLAVVLDKVVSEVLAQQAQEKAGLGPPIFFVVPGVPVGKPRMTQRDTWMKRPAVVRYRDYADRLRAAAPKFPELPPAVLEMEAWLPMPVSWSANKKAALVGQHHRQRSDVDNIVKSILDSLFKEDSTVWKITAEKFWAAPGQERTIVRVWFQ